MRRLNCLFCALLLWHSGGASGSCAQPLRVFAAVSLTESLKEIGAAYEQQHGVKLLYNFGASSQLARQIEEGAPADLFFSADAAKVDGLEARGLLVPGTRRRRLSNRLVLIVAAEGAPKISTPEDLATASVRRLALADPRAVPAGIYARVYLENKGIWPRVAAKVVPVDSVRAALAAVESGNVEAGMVYKTDAALSRKVRVVYEVPAAESPAIDYVMALPKETANLTEARRFLQYLDSQEAGRVFQKWGFIVPTTSPAP